MNASINTRKWATLGYSAFFSVACIVSIIALCAILYGVFAHIARGDTSNTFDASFDKKTIFLNYSGWSILAWLANFLIIATLSFGAARNMFSTWSAGRAAEHPDYEYDQLKKCLWQVAQRKHDIAWDDAVRDSMQHRYRVENGNPVVVPRYDIVPLYGPAADYADVEHAYKKLKQNSQENLWQ